MRGLWTCGPVIAALCLLSPALASRAAATIGVDELRPGMTGYGLSVFNPGGSIDTFRVELVDVMRGVAPGGDMILARCTGQGLEHSGIVAGMSGSPVYFEGRLAGALAYGWGFAKDPIAGITPIGEMLELLKTGDWQGGTRPRPGSPRSSAVPDHQSPIPLPLGIAGASPELVALAGSLLEPFGLMPVAAGRALPPGQGESAPDRFRPGGAVGVLLADGDVRYSAIGTVTWVENDRLLAFGHPMFQAGAIRLPMSHGVVHAVMPSYASSFKLFSAGPPVGTLVEDRRPAVGGIIGPVPPMLPVRVSLVTARGREDHHFRIADFEPLLPYIAGLGIAEIVFAGEGFYDEATLEARVVITLAGGRTVSLRHVHTGRAPADALARTVMDRLRLLVENRFAPVRVESLDVALELRPGRNRLTLTNVAAARRVVAPGDTIALRLELLDDDGRSSFRRMDVDIPATVPPGRLVLTLSSADTFLLRDLGRGAGTEPRDLDELLRLLERTGDEDVLVIAGYSAAPGLTLGTREMPTPPPTLRRILGHRAGRVRPLGESRLLLERHPLGAVVAGTHEIPLEVKR